MKILSMEMWSKFLKKLKKDNSEHRHENEVCKNCETVFSGNFCPECGQSVKDYDRPFSFIFYNFVGDFFAFDTRFFRTFAALIAKPGFLTKQYFDGKRVLYAPPFRIFIFVSFIMFLLLQIYTNRGLTKVLDSDLNGLIGSDSASITNTDSLLNVVKAEIDTGDSLVVDSILSEIGILSHSADSGDVTRNINREKFHGKRDLRQILNGLANKMEEDLDGTTDPKKRAKVLEFIRLARSPEQAVAKFLEYLSWAFFLLLPIFALLLKLLYIRRRQNYIRHLIFSIHIHSFIFVVFTIILILFMLTNGSVENSIVVSKELRNISFLLILSLPIYSVIAIKKFYGQSLGKAIVKFITVSFLYNVIFWVAVGIVFLNAIGVI